MENESQADSKEIDTLTSYTHPNRDLWQEGVQCMLKVANHTSQGKYKKLVHQAQYNVGKAFYQGFGVKQSDKEAETYWLLSSDNGSSEACTSAMTALAFFYSRKNDPEFYDLEKTFYWHNEACGKIKI